MAYFMKIAYGWLVQRGVKRDDRDMPAALVRSPNSSSLDLHTLSLRRPYITTNSHRGSLDRPSAVHGLPYRSLASISISSLIGRASGTCETRRIGLGNIIVSL